MNKIDLEDVYAQKQMCYLVSRTHIQVFYLVLMCFEVIFLLQRWKLWDKESVSVFHKTVWCV